MENFKLIEPNNLNESSIRLIGFDWMLITAGNKGNFNTMTASWGGLGFLWSKPVAFIFIRPQRFTYNFVETNNFFTLCFFEPKFKAVLNYCGTKSGRNSDKITDTGLTPLQTAQGGIYFDEARLVLNCKKIYFDNINPDHFVDKNLLVNYPDKDFHRMYIGEILECFIKE